MPWQHQREVIGELYDAALGQRPWQEVGRALMGAMGGHTLILMAHQPLFQVTEIIDTQNLPDESLQTYAAHYAPQDVWIRGMEEKKLTDRPVVGTDLIDDRSFEETEFYYDFLKPRVPMFHITCGLLTLGEGRRAVLGIHRPRDAGTFDSAEVARMGSLLRHVRSSLFLRRRMQQANALAESALLALDQLTVGVILLGSAGKVLHINPAADAILRANDGLGLRDGGLHAANSDEDRRLQALVAGARHTMVDSRHLQGAGGRTRVRRPSGRPAYALAVTPAGRNLAVAGVDKAAALVFVSDPTRRPSMHPETLEVQFGLTPVIARLVRALVSGQSLLAYAKAAGISHNTARKQLARACALTNTNSQLELLRLVYMADPGITGQR